ncbi:hypothetical protein [Mesotoga sp.]|uniref:hypothetical protein n=1 Tax=Mesotoga sp. TaxID=2053577 RepID=UPI00345F159F
MRLVPKRSWQLKNLKLSFLFLTIGMVIASAYTAYCVFTKEEVLQANPKLWGVVIGVYAFTALSATYYFVLNATYRRRKRTDW